jgi:hypothetical protein
MRKNDRAKLARLFRINEYLAEYDILINRHPTIEQDISNWMFKMEVFLVLLRAELHDQLADNE